MIDPNRDTSKEVLRQHKELSHERFRTQFAEAVEQKLIDFEMTWEELAEKLWPVSLIGIGGDNVKETVKSGILSAGDMNEIAHVFSCEPYIILRPREPWIKT